MKKYNIFIYITMALFLIGCNKHNTTPLESNTKSVELTETQIVQTNFEESEEEQTFLSEDATKNNITETEAEKSILSESVSEDDRRETIEITEATNAAEATGIVLDLFIPNQNVTGFDVKEVIIDSLSPEAILKTLAANTDIDITVNSFTQLEEGGEKALKLDVSSNLSDFLVGSTGEYMTIGSICNTFLTAYNADKILITTDGTLPRTGHIDYSVYLYFYEP